MTADRSQDPGSRLWTYAYDHDVLVVCPRCAARAVVRDRRLTCPACALVRETDGRTTSFGSAHDPWFHEPLWLAAPFRGHVVWALSAAHVEALRCWIGAHLRERTERSRSAHCCCYEASMVAQLPAWLTSAKNRDGVVAVLDDLAARAA